VDADQYAKQYEIADFDLMWCQLHLVAYIEIMTPPENAGSDVWLTLRSREFGGDHNFLDILARSLMTSIVLSYTRPWCNNRGPDGRLRLPKQLFFDMSQLFKREDPEERLLPFDHDIHDRVLGMRDRVIAHSDHSEWRFEVHRTSGGIETNLKDPFTYLTLEEARVLLRNTRSLRSELSEYRRRALNAGETRD
jgi:hypothetical protein